MSNRQQSSSNNGGVANVIAGACINLNMPLSLRGGGSSSALQSTTAAVEVETEAPTEIFRTDYKPLPYKVSNVSMNFDIRDGKTVVESELTVVPNTLDGGKFVLCAYLMHQNISIFCSHLMHTIIYLHK